MNTTKTELKPEKTTATKAHVEPSKRQQKKRCWWCCRDIEGVLPISAAEVVSQRSSFWTTNGRELQDTKSRPFSTSFNLLSI